MLKTITSVFLSLLCIGFVSAQEEQNLYDIALQRIEEAQETGAIELDLAGLGLTELPHEIGSLNNLQILSIRHNQLSSLPHEIGNLINLETLNLDYNQLSNLPPEFGNLRNLQVLGLVGNQLTSLPPEIGNLSNLRELYLASNQLSTLPPEFGNLANLSFFVLSDNLLTSLPHEIGNLSNLRYFYLGTNQLSSLPPEIGKLSNLCVLNLFSNNFVEIPSELAPLKQLGNGENCDTYSLRLDDYLLDTLPDEVAAGGTTAILVYLDNVALWQLQKLIPGASALGLLTLLALVLRWKNRRHYSKKKRETF